MSFVPFSFFFFSFQVGSREKRRKFFLFFIGKENVRLKDPWEWWDQWRKFICNCASEDHWSQWWNFPNTIAFLRNHVDQEKSWFLFFFNRICVEEKHRQWRNFLFCGKHSIGNVKWKRDFSSRRNTSSNSSFFPIEFTKKFVEMFPSSIRIGRTFALIALITSIANFIVILFAFYYEKNDELPTGKKREKIFHQWNQYHWISCFIFLYHFIEDYFILNMAIGHFLVGFLCIPFDIPFHFGELTFHLFNELNVFFFFFFFDRLTQRWPFGRLFCQMWVRKEEEEEEKWEELIWFEDRKSVV